MSLFALSYQNVYALAINSGVAGNMPIRCRQMYYIQGINIMLQVSIEKVKWVSCSIRKKWQEMVIM